MARHERLDLLGGPFRRASWDVVPGVLGEHVRLDATGGNAVDRDAALSKVGSKRLDEANDGHLGGVVQSVVLYTEEAGGNGAHEDDAAIVLDVLVCGLADEELGSGVEVEDMVVFLLCDFLRLVPALCARVAHDNVDFAKGLLGLLEQPLDLGDFAHVRLDGNGLGPVVEAPDDFAHFVRGAF